MRKSVVLENFAGGAYMLIASSGGVLSFMDENLSPVDLQNDMTVIIHQRVKDLFHVIKPGDAYARVIEGQGEAMVSIINAGPAKYLVWGSESGYAEISCSMSVARNTKLSYPLGLFGDDVYPSEIAITDVRAKFNAGDKYFYVNNNTLYIFKTSGSIGNIGTITASAEQGSSEMTLNTVANLLVGDCITVNSVDYIIRAINATTSKITVHRGIPSALSNASVTLTAPTYTTV